MIKDITPLIITLNEASNIQRTLDRLVWADRIVVIDSGSTDGTLEILRAHPQVDTIHRPFSDFASQCNFGLEQIRTSWVLSLDADYVLSQELVEELATLHANEATAGFRARFAYRILGRSLRGSLYPARVVLYRTNRATYHCEGHGHRVTVSGNIRALTGLIYHDDRKPLSRWFASQQRYAAEEANYLMTCNKAQLSMTDRIRRWAWAAPILVFFYTLVVKGCILDGWRGWYYVLQRTFAELLIAIEIVDRRLAQHRGST